MYWWVARSPWRRGVCLFLLSQDGCQSLLVLVTDSSLAHFYLFFFTSSLIFTKLNSTSDQWSYRQRSPTPQGGECGMSLSTVTPAVTRRLPTPPILPPGHCGSFSGHFSLSLSSPPAKFIMKFLSLSAHIDKRVPPRVGSVVCLFLLSLQLSQDGCQHPSRVVMEHCGLCVLSLPWDSSPFQPP